MEINIGLLLVGLIFGATGVAIIVKYLKGKIHNTALVTAKVSHYDVEERHTSRGRSITYYAVLRYYADGDWHENRNMYGSGTQKYEVGEEVDILYDPDHPDSFIIVGDNGMLFGGIACFLIGAGVCLLAIFG